ncbi:Predicted nucleic acid-binding protein, contains PIN domain [Xaviernesmea oryzae]|uniref:Predicted nucleic acid-binding protein, contains PIN domain n=1 Tax=Xaviernesmea oryzae TaxID=464029 RepID=A0A1X7GVT6_9HYPH|nr:type II toxin-antitoxin system VapC family toxin [Xaviernesmea oryzae]SMF75274.1 Predicted nucleic acid-binding protein, contains PIN domain [Xaviernesmea oryzae]
MGALLSASEYLADTPAKIVPDTNVYIRFAAGSLPLPILALMLESLAFHCSVCISELATGVANADPYHPGWREFRDHYSHFVTTIPAVRLLTPDPQIWTEAGLIAGTLARTQNFKPHQRKECLNDALIFLTAAKAGLPVLTSNRDEFDLIQQLAPHGQFIHY